MMDADIKKSVSANRFPLGLWTLLFLPYLPLGLVLCLFRICLSLQALLILLLFPEGRIKRFMLRVFMTVMGIFVKTDGQVSNSKLFIANRISFIDHIALHLAAQCITVSTGATTPPLSSLHPHWSTPFTDSERVMEAAKRLPQFDDSVSVVDYVPYVVQPEPQPTNGSHALMKFSQWPFSLNSSIQPLALSVFRPFPISVTTFSGSGWFDFMWTLFSPITFFHVKFLPVMELSGDESPSDFSARVKQSLASSLNLVVSEITEDDVKKLLTASPPPSPPPPSPPPSPPVVAKGPIISPSEFDPSSMKRSASLELESKVHQVTAVLPHIPHHVIRKDLMRTNSVDMTITNLLEGKVQYNTSYMLAATAGSRPKTSASHVFKRKAAKSPPPPAAAAAPQQPQHGSLEQRKKELVDNARKKYLSKHEIQK